MWAMVPQAIDSNRQSYEHRHPIWKITVIPSVLAIVVLVVLSIFTHVSPFAALCVLTLIGLALVRAVIIDLRGSWESRIESGALALHYPGRIWSRIQLAGLSEVVHVSFSNQDR